jgi:Protein of unknown function (DUF1800)
MPQYFVRYVVRKVIMPNTIPKGVPNFSRRDFLRLVGGSAMAATLSSQLANIKWSGTRPAYAAEVSREMHVLNRLTWMPLQRDVDKIRELGVEGYIDWQLNPEAIPDPVMDMVLANVPLVNADFRALKEAQTTDYGIANRTLVWMGVYRPYLSERQLLERVVEFWCDHFNIPVLDDGIDRFIDEREVARRYAFTTFRELLFASAQSPAMMYYLNQDSNGKEHPNENYAREVMELHTLGVDGGYTERDVKEVARAFTGWTVRDGLPNRFFFDMNEHDTDEKTVLGVTLPAGRGIEDGLDVLNILASHPSTARFISAKLCRRFVADKPPQSLIDSTAEVFTQTGGNIKAILRHIFLSAEFTSAVNQKLRRPLDYMVAMLRVTQASVDNGDYLYAYLSQANQVPFSWRPPNGYPDIASAWVNTNGLMLRWRLAMSLVEAERGWINGVSVDPSGQIGPVSTCGELVDKAAALVFPAMDLAAEDRQQLIDLVSDGQGPDRIVDMAIRVDKIPVLVAMLIASPYFQWR